MLQRIVDIYGLLLQLLLNCSRFHRVYVEGQQETDVCSGDAECTYTPPSLFIAAFCTRQHPNPPVMPWDSTYRSSTLLWFLGFTAWFKV